MLQQPRTANLPYILIFITPEIPPTAPVLSHYTNHSFPLFLTDFSPIPKTWHDFLVFAKILAKHVQIATETTHALYKLSTTTNTANRYIYAIKKCLRRFGGPLKLF